MKKKTMISTSFFAAIAATAALAGACSTGETVPIDDGNWSPPVVDDTTDGATDESDTTADDGDTQDPDRGDGSDETSDGNTDDDNNSDDGSGDPPQDSEPDQTDDPDDTGDGQTDKNEDTDTGPSCPPLEGVGNSCANAECSCDNICSDVLVSDQLQVLQAFCHADCNENISCPGSENLCVGIPSDEGDDDPIGMCMPLGRTSTGNWRAKIFPSTLEPASEHLTSGFSIVTTNAAWSGAQNQNLGLGMFDSAEQSYYLSFYGQPSPNEQWLVQIAIPQSSWKVGTIDLSDDPAAFSANVLYMTYDAVTDQLKEVWFKAVSGFEGTLIIESTGQMCAPASPSACSPASGSFDIELIGFDLEFNPDA